MGRVAESKIKLRATKQQKKAFAEGQKKNLQDIEFLQWCMSEIPIIHTDIF